MYNANNIFAKIIKGEIPAEKLYEDEQVIAIKDAYPIAPIHILVIPKGQYTSFDDFTEKASIKEIGHFYKVVQTICSNLKLNKNGYRILSNIGEHGLQSVPHMHLHILAGEKLTKFDSGRS